MSKQIIGVLLLGLAILNYFGYLELYEVLVFSCSLGALLFTISDCFFDGLKIWKINFSKIFSFTFRFLGVACFLIFNLWKDQEAIIQLKETIGVNTILLCSLGFMLIHSKSSEIIRIQTDLKIREAVAEKEKEYLD